MLGVQFDRLSNVQTPGDPPHRTRDRPFSTPEKAPSADRDNRSLWSFLMTEERDSRVSGEAGGFFRVQSRRSRGGWEAQATELLLRAVASVVLTLDSVCWVRAASPSTSWLFA